MALGSPACGFLEEEAQSTCKCTDEINVNRNSTLCSRLDIDILKETTKKNTCCANNLYVSTQHTLPAGILCIWKDKVCLVKGKSVQQIIIIAAFINLSGLRRKQK